MKKLSVVLGMALMSTAMLCACGKREAKEVGSQVVTESNVEAPETNETDEISEPELSEEEKAMRESIEAEIERSRYTDQMEWSVERLFNAETPEMEKRFASEEITHTCEEAEEEGHLEDMKAHFAQAEVLERVGAESFDAILEKARKYMERDFMEFIEQEEAMQKEPEAEPEVDAIDVQVEDLIGESLPVEAIEANTANPDSTVDAPTKPVEGTGVVYDAQSKEIKID